METQIKKKRASRAKPKTIVKVEKLDLDEYVIDMGSVAAPAPTKLTKPKKFQAMGFYKDGGLYYWSHVEIDGDKATVLDRGPGDVKAHVLDDFKIQIVKRILSKEFEG